MAVFVKITNSLLKQVGNARIIRNLSGYHSFKEDDLIIQMTRNARPKPALDSLVFGKEMSDHMLEVDWSVSEGWSRPRIVPYHNFSMSPAAKCLHYATEIFEGMKAFRGEDGNIRLFRPDQNVARMKVSAERACLPDFDSEELLGCIKTLVSIDRDWVPQSNTSSLYIRPTLIGTEPSLGISPTQNALLYVITGPVGAYFPGGMKPVSLLADPQFVRAWPGGAGYSKMGSNYAPTLYIQQFAAAKNCQQVLWLYGEEQNLTEAGMMNLFIFMINENGEEELVTPPIDSGIILPGVTRKSFVELARHWGEFKVSERNINMAEVVQALEDNRIMEMFGAGTACVVCPVERIHYQGEDLHIPTMDNGAPITMRFLKELKDIQYGCLSPPPGANWIEVVEKRNRLQSLYA